MIARKIRLRALWSGVAVVAAVLANVMPGPARAGEFPASGETNYDRYVYATVLDSASGSVRRGVTFTDVAVSRNPGAEGPWFGLVDRCAGQFTMLGEEVTRGTGTCVKRDKDGDAMFVTWEGEAWTIIGGTGKYRGIKGAGSTTVNPFLDSQHRQDAWASVVHHTVRWQIDPAPAPRTMPQGVANAGLGG